MGCASAVVHVMVIGIPLMDWAHHSRRSTPSWEARRCHACSHASRTEGSFRTHKDKHACAYIHSFRSSQSTYTHYSVVVEGLETNLLKP